MLRRCRTSRTLTGHPSVPKRPGLWLEHVARATWYSSRRSWCSSGDGVRPSRCSRSIRASVARYSSAAASPETMTAPSRSRGAARAVVGMLDVERHGFVGVERDRHIAVTVEAVRCMRDTVEADAAAGWSVGRLATEQADVEGDAGGVNHGESLHYSVPVLIRFPLRLVLAMTRPCRGRSTDRVRAALPPRA